MTFIAIAQFNPTVGDFEGNGRRILEWVILAEEKGADLIVFPELSISGYPVWDLANKKDFIDANLKVLQDVVSFTKKKKVAVVIGFIDKPEKYSPRSFNSLAWIENGKIRARYHKRLLPTYDVFLEDIFFEPGNKPVVISWKGKKIGLSICEDLWDDTYSLKPLRELKKQKADFVINISCSPYYQGVDAKRKKLVRRHVRENNFPVLYVNQVGAQDDLIFDGQSFFVEAKGKVLFEAPAFEEGMYFVDLEATKSSRADVSVEESPIAEMYSALCLGIKDYCRKNGFKRVILGLSGGIDSALVAALAVDALGKDAVLGITMPGEFSSEGSWKDSEELARNLGIEIRKHPIVDIYHKAVQSYRGFQKSEGRAIPEPEKITLGMENLQARLRGLNLMFWSNEEGYLLLTTGNKSELAMGYCTLYGDMAGGLCVIGDVYKTDVYKLAYYRNTIKKVIPDAVLEKAPSAELRPDQKDQDSLPPYDLLDEVLRLYIEGNKSRNEMAAIIKSWLQVGDRKKVAEYKEFHSEENLSKLISQIVRKVDHNEYKRRQTPPILRVTQKAWFGRRMPITNRFQG